LIEDYIVSVFFQPAIELSVELDYHSLYALYFYLKILNLTEEKI